MAGVMTAMDKNIYKKLIYKKRVEKKLVTVTSSELSNYIFFERHKTHSQHSVARVVIHEYGLCHGCNV